ncbi:ARM repeat superfamily protein [Klebsormidium nitens]|uniref:ARM repeat superfamily protein n=1 Tax=Klebsormidium nitens TaxID=105231 RepID=A0A1Y1HIT4_KLENI|nr:ARM repeat superfamily protein [Klebsormidium nitens]|eukprot:GAQ78414.1 ARM repeat superfamily protein [Klebsormidium nitens]
MSSKERPTLGGARIKTRKRNIAVPNDPSGFADNVIQFFRDKDGDLDAISKVIGEVDDLDFSRYGDTLFEVIFTGHALQPGSVVPLEDASDQPWNVLACEPTKSGILVYVSFVQKLIRRRPFLIKNLENNLQRLLQSLEHYGPEDRKKLAVFTALTFSQKLGLPPETIFEGLLKDAIVQKGTVLSFLTEFCKEYLADNKFEELVSLLKRAKVDDRLLEFFPMQKRTVEAFNDHFHKAGLDVLVEYNNKKVFDIKLRELKATVTTMISEEAPVDDVIAFAKKEKKDSSLPEVDVLLDLWDAMMDAVQWSGKNQQQNTNLALRQVKGRGKLLGAFSTTSKAEFALIYKVQACCYEDAKLMKLFAEIVRILYDLDVLGEDTILTWYRKGTNPKGRQVFVKALEPFVKWLEEAEEEDDE